MEPRILLLADKLAEELFAEGSPADLVRRFARELPLSVICELLGLPLEDRPKFSAWAHRLTRASGPIGFLRMIPDLYAMKRYMAQRLDIAREQGGEGLIAELARVESEGKRISRDEMVSMLFLLLFAGHETTTHLISGSVRELLLSPDLRDWLKEDWSRAEPATEEFLRFVSPVQFTKPRVVRRDMEFGGIALRKGDRIMPMLTAANLDPDANPRPEKLNLERKPNKHMAFGAGIHFCLGHQLARIEGRCALQSLFQRWPKLALAVDDSQNSLADTNWHAGDRSAAGGSGGLAYCYCPPLHLLQLDQRPIEILGVEKQHRLAVRADLRGAVAQRAGAGLRQLIPRGDDVVDLEAQMVHAAVGVVPQILRDRRIGAERLQQLDLRVRQFDERHGHAMLR